MQPAVLFTVVSFTEDDVFDGSLHHSFYEDAAQEVHEVDSVEEAAEVIRARGLDFASTGNDWAASPDGSRLVDYAEGRREEVTAKLLGFSDADSNRVVELVG